MAQDHENKQAYDEEDPALADAAQQDLDAAAPELGLGVEAPADDGIEADAGTVEDDGSQAEVDGAAERLLADKVGGLLLAEKAYLSGRHKGVGAAVREMIRDGELPLADSDADELGYLSYQVIVETDRVLGAEVDAAQSTAAMLVAASEQLQDLYDQIAGGATPSMDTVRAVILAANGSLVKASEAHGIQSERVYAREEDRRMWDGEGPGPEYKGVKRIIN